jgi:hypothetical protein
MLDTIKYSRPARALIILVAVGGLLACESEADPEPAKTEHVWKDQTGAIDKAREVETLLKQKKNQESQ